MAQGKRNRLSTEQRIEMWRRWKAGESLHEIGRALGKGHGSIRFLLTQRGGIVPAARRRSPRTLTLAEREDISRGIASGSSIRETASGLQRPVSTVSREVARHGGRPLYRASEADRQAWESALRPKACLLANHEELRTIVASKLILDWSPEQISKWLKVSYPRNESMRMSHETIYRSLFIQARGVLKKSWFSTSGPNGLYVAHGTRGLTENPRVRSSMPSPSGKDLRRLRIALFPVTGRAICSQAAKTLTSQPW
ncbi:helix-turn-helix domain-containing protein (plasmid) [Tunturiibacter gelidiferens]